MITRTNVLAAAARVALTDALRRTGEPRPGRAVIWTEEDVYYDLAHDLARGSYQRAIVQRQRLVSGSDLRGRAKDWSRKYRASVEALLSRLDAAKIPHYTDGCGLLVVGRPDPRSTCQAATMHPRTLCAVSADTTWSRFWAVASATEACS